MVLGKMLVVSLGAFEVARYAYCLQIGFECEDRSNDMSKSLNIIDLIRYKTN